MEIRVNDDGFYTLMIGASDMGTGCDTILAQMAADCLECSMDQIVVHGTDTDVSPYDSGSYASSTTYLTGMAGCPGLRGTEAENRGKGSGLLRMRCSAAGI